MLVVPRNRFVLRLCCHCSDQSTQCGLMYSARYHLTFTQRAWIDLSCSYTIFVEMWPVEKGKV